MRQSISLLGVTAILAAFSSTALSNPLSARQATTLSPFEPANGQLLFGAWYDRFTEPPDTPSLVNQRLGKDMSFFQANINIPEDVKLVPGHLAQVDKTGTDAIFYLTVYPMSGFDRVTEGDIVALAKMLDEASAAGRRILIRYAPEMNGSWFIYGQKPAQFIAAWKTFVTTVRKNVKDNSKLAFLWAPNSSNGYPFLGGLSSPANTTAAIGPLDTNKDGKFDFWDDPYTPFYPGDEFVDWVGLSMYHYGREYPWIDNVVPNPGVFEAMLTGKPPMSAYDFYSMFSGSGTAPNVTTPASSGRKPFMVAETAATFHLGFANETTPAGQEAPLNPGPGMLAIKQGWWKQIFNTTFLDAHPEVKGVCFFEFKKQEEETLREFRTLGDHKAGNGRDSNDENAVAQAFKKDLQAFDSRIAWAKEAKIKATSLEDTSNGASSRAPATLGIAVVAASAVLSMLV